MMASYRYSLLFIFTYIILAISAHAQSSLYELNFHNSYLGNNLNLDKNDFKKIVPRLREINDFVNKEGNDAFSFFNVISILKDDEFHLKRLILRCDDCQREYYLLYQNSCNISIIEESTPQKLLQIILSQLINDEIILSEDQMLQIVNEVFFYFKYNKYHSNFSGGYRIVPRK